MVHTTVVQRIEALAAEQGLPSGKALAKRFGVSYETLRKWRSGDAAPNRSRQLIIAKELRVKPEVFMFAVEAGKSPDSDFEPQPSPAAMDLARRFDAVGDLKVQKALYARLLDEIRIATGAIRPPAPAPTAAPDPIAAQALGKSPAPP